MAIVEVPTSSATRRRVSALGPSVAISRAAAAINAARCCGLSVRFVVDTAAITVLYHNYSDAIQTEQVRIGVRDRGAGRRARLPLPGRPARVGAPRRRRRAPGVLRRQEHQLDRAAVLRA